MKLTKSQKRFAAVERMKQYKWENAKANRKGTRSQEKWIVWNKEEIDRISKIH